MNPHLPVVYRFFCLFFLLLCSLTYQGCSRQGYGQRGSAAQSPFYVDGRPKPVVALPPLINGTCNTAPARVVDALVDTLGSGLLLRFLERDRLYLSSVDREKSAESRDPFGGDLLWIKEAYPDKEYVIFIKLVEYEEIPLTEQKEGTGSLLLKAGILLRIVDLSGREALLSLHETVRTEQYLPRQFAQEGAEHTPYALSDKAITPRGLVEEKLIQALLLRVENVIFSSTL